MRLLKAVTLIRLPILIGSGGLNSITIKTSKATVCTVVVECSSSSSSISGLMVVTAHGSRRNHIYNGIHVNTISGNPGNHTAMTSAAVSTTPKVSTNTMETNTINTNSTNSTNKTNNTNNTNSYIIIIKLTDGTGAASICQEMVSTD
jgi:hypothetical protein